jgi:hypothetical protein
MSYDEPTKYEKMAAWLRKRGFTHLAGGSFSEVFETPDPDKVIKVNRTNDDWPVYIQWANSIGTKFAPKLYSFKQYPDHRYIAIIERVHRIGNDVTITTEFDNAISSLHSATRYDWKVYETDADRVRIKMRGKAALLDKWQPGFIEYYVLLRYTFGYIDFGLSNFGIRSDGTLVVLDPIVGAFEGMMKTERSKYTSQRIKQVA